MKHSTLSRCSLFLCVIGLLLGFSPVARVGATASSALASGPTAGVTVEIISCPTTVQMGDAITVRWRITGGAAVSQTRVEWGLDSGHTWGNESYYSGAPGEYQHTFSAPFAARLYLGVMARVDGSEYRSEERVVDISYTCSFDDNHDPAHPAPITIGQTYTGCFGDSCEAYYTVNIPACSVMEVYATWAAVAPGSRGGGSIEVYDASGPDRYGLSRVQRCDGALWPYHHQRGLGHGHHGLDLGLPVQQRLHPARAHIVACAGE